MERVEVGFAESETQSDLASVEFAPAALLGPFDGMVNTVAKEFGSGATREAFDGLAIRIEHFDANGAGSTGREIQEELITCADEGLGEDFAFLSSGADSSETIGAESVKSHVTAIGRVVMAAIETERVRIELHEPLGDHVVAANPILGIEPGFDIGLGEVAIVGGAAATGHEDDIRNISFAPFEDAESLRLLGGHPLALLHEA